MFAALTADMEDLHVLPPHTSRETEQRAISMRHYTVPKLVASCTELNSLSLGHGLRHTYLLVKACPFHRLLTQFDDTRQAPAQLF
jgi:hypothetical protein